MKKRERLLDKKKVLKSVKEMPDQFDIDEIIDRLIILHKMEQALADSAAGRTISHEEAKKQFAKWRS